MGFALGATGEINGQVFGLAAQGNRFAYVFDRSGSMGGPGKNLLHAAKAELLRSLDLLGDLQQFQIIFYNESPTIMRLAARFHITWQDEDTLKIESDAGMQKLRPICLVPSP